MNFLDIAILVILGAFILKGVLRGLLKELCALAGLLLGALLAFRFHPPLAEMLVETFGLPSRLCVIGAFLALFLATVMFFGVLGFLLSRFVKLVFLGGLNRVAGAVFGLVQGGVLLAVVLYGLSLAELPGSLDRSLKNSQLAPPFVQLGRSVFDGGGRLLSQRL